MHLAFLQIQQLCRHHSAAKFADLLLLVVVLFCASVIKLLPCNIANLQLNHLEQSQLSKTTTKTVFKAENEPTLFRDMSSGEKNVCCTHITNMMENVYGMTKSATIFKNQRKPPHPENLALLI